MRIDLHTHSVLSDGSDSPAELVEKAKAVGLDVVALTDRDITTGWAEAIAAGKRLGITVVPGIEFSTTNEGRGQHLLGYNLDPTHPAIAEILERGAESREGRIPALLARLDELGVPVDPDYVRSIAGGTPSRKHVAAAIVHAGHVASDDEAFATYLNEGGPAYIQRYRPTIEATIAAIRAAGGVSVIAHPCDGKRGAGVSAERFAQLAAAGLDGIEIDHQQHPSDIRTALREIASDLGLFATGSSDYHGTRKTGHDLTCNVTDPEQARRLLGADFRGR